MSVFQSEAQMQAWLSKALDETEGLGELIENTDWLKTTVAHNLGESCILGSYSACVDSLHLTETLFENENISVTPPDILKPDFILYAIEAESIAVVELKNFSSASRQAGTELGAYTAEIRTCVPFLSDGDVIHVLISEEWPTLLKHYVRHEIFWQRRKMLCLYPFRKQDNSIVLEILPITELAEDYTSFQIGKRHLGGFNISLYDDNLYNHDADRHRLSSAVQVFKVALHAMATTGNRLNSHGFAFLWKDKWTESLAPYSIVVANFAPFTSLDRFVKTGGVSKVIERLIQVVVEHCPEGHGNTLSEISDTCTNLVAHVCNPRLEGFTNWDALSASLENRIEYLEFVGWGMFGDAAVEEVKARHQNGDLTCSLTNPDVGLAVLAKLIDENCDVLDLSCYFHDSDDTHF